MVKKGKGTVKKWPFYYAYTIMGHTVYDRETLWDIRNSISHMVFESFKPDVSWPAEILQSTDNKGRDPATPQQNTAGFTAESETD